MQITGRRKFKKGGCFGFAWLQGCFALVLLVVLGASLCISLTCVSHEFFSGEDKNSIIVVIIYIAKLSLRLRITGHDDAPALQTI